MQEPEILIAETNPYGTFEAVVEDDGRTVYLYLRSTQQFDFMKALWVANREKAPKEDDIAAMEAGQAPLMPRRGTRHPFGHGVMTPDFFEMVWFEEGDAVALLYRDKPVAVMPGWSGVNGFAGYAAEAVGEERLAWDLTGALEGLTPRIQGSRSYWERREDPEDWRRYQGQGLAHLERILGQLRQYWAADNGGFPPRAILSFAHPSLEGVSIVTTLGMGAQRMPLIEQYVEDPAPYRRVELAAATSGDPARLASLLSGLMMSPWRTGTFLGEGHTTSFAEPSETPGQSAILLSSQPPPHVAPAGERVRSVPAPNLNGLRDISRDPITFLWCVPIRDSEQGLAQEHGSDTLAGKLTQERRGWVWPA